MQTSTLDLLNQPTTMKEREDFRRFLVDGHRAAYIPVCIAGPASNNLTAEPAMVIPFDDNFQSNKSASRLEWALAGQLENTPLLGEDR